MNSDKVLDIKNLSVSFDTYNGEIQAVRDVSFYVKRGETLGIVGESGCGKSVTVKSINKLFPMPPARIKSGQILFEGNDITHYGNREMQKIRGKEISMIFQDPMTCLNPTKRIGNQIIEVILKHNNTSKGEARNEAIEMMKLVGLPNPEIRYNQYPHEFSGGMRQRAMIALAMISNPKLLIADEPTTALDVTIQSQILKLMQKIQNKFETSIIMITHDLGVIADISQRVAVMYAGKIIEMGNVDDIFFEPKHPYTWGLLQSVPHVEKKKKEDLCPIEGTPPDLFAPPRGCPFAARCNYTMKICKENFPPETKLTENHFTHCWLLDRRAPKIQIPVMVERSL